MKARFGLGVVVGTAVIAADAGSRDAAAQPIKPGELAIYEENDFFYHGAPKEQRTDRWYTQGLRIEWTHASNEDQEFIFDVPANFWCRLLCGANYDQGFTNAGWAIGQSIYTPQDISIAEPQPDDRPWAGYLYVSRLVKQSYRLPTWDAERQDRFEVSLGVVGPLALGREAQNFIHRIKGVGAGMGWDNQLDNEPTILLGYESVLRFPACARFVDFQPYGRAFVGTVLTAADVGATVRVGYNLSGFARGGIVPTARTDCPPTPEGFLSSLSLFTRAQARVVAHTIFIDGSLFGDDLGLRKKTVVYEGAIGVDVALFGRWGLAFQLVNRSEEYEGPVGIDGIHRFGSIQIHRTN